MRTFGTGSRPGPRVEWTLRITRGFRKDAMSRNDTHWDMTSSPVLRWSLLIMLSFAAVSAAVGGVMGVFFDGAGVPHRYLDGTPFDSFVAPGLILGVVVGGTHAVAALAVYRRDRVGALAAAVAGFGMMIWIFVELAMILEFSWLQVLYFAIGLCEVVLVLLLGGILDTRES